MQLLIYEVNVASSYKSMVRGVRKAQQNVCAPKPERGESWNGKEAIVNRAIDGSTYPS